MDNQLTVVSQQEVRSKLSLGNLFYPLLPWKRAVLSLKRAALASRQDTNVAFAPVDNETTVTPRPPACRSVTSYCQQYPLPVPVATRPSPQDFLVIKPSQ